MADYNIHHYEVIVGNIGTVYDGNDLQKAIDAFHTYRDQSKSGTGRAAHEDVTVMKNGKMRWHHQGRREG